jgi:hypothetical protein
VFDVVGKLQVRREHSRTGHRDVRTRIHTLRLGGKLVMIRYIQHARSAISRRIAFSWWQGRETMVDTCNDVKFDDVVR